MEEIFDTLILSQEQGIEQGARIIREGGVVAFATETVYGLGGDTFNESAIKKIYEAKGRPSDNPLIVHISDAEDIASVCDEVPPLYFELSKRFCPGPLTMVVPRGKRIPYCITAGLESVAVRMPLHPVARELIRASGTLIAAPSANRSSHISPTTAQHVYDDLKGRIPLIIDGGECSVGIESTVLSLVTPVPTILRPGAVTKEMLLEVLDSVKLHTGSVAVAPAPGMKYRHYAPACPCYLGNSPEHTLKIASDIRAHGKHAVILAMTRNLAIYKGENTVDLGDRGEDIAKHLYGGLRYGELNADAIIIDRLPDGGVYDSVMNRVLKAVAGN